MNSSLTGYNMEQVQQLSTSATTVGNAIETIIQDAIEIDVLNELYPIWYAQKGIDFANKVKASFEGLGPKISAAINSFLAYAGGVANGWSKFTGSGKTAAMPDVELTGISIGTENFKAEDTSGNEGMDEAKVTELAGKIPSIKSAVANNIEGHKATFKATTAFLGGTQAEECEKCFNKILDDVNAAMDEMSTQLQTALEEHQQSYDQAKQDAASLFSNPQTVSKPGSNTGGNPSGPINVTQ